MTAVCSLQTGAVALAAVTAYRGGGGLMVAVALAVAVLMLTAVAEWRGRIHAERSRDAVRADAVRILLAAADRLDEADREIRRFHAAMPQSIVLDPDVEHLREAGRLVLSAHNVVSQGKTLLGG